MDYWGIVQTCRLFALVFPLFGFSAAAAPDSLVGNVAWESDLPFGTFSSPRLTNTASKSEILMAFGNEDSVAGGVVALDVVSGTQRWRVNAEQELFALPIPLTPTPEGIQPWVVAGRNGQLHAINAVSGELLWRFLPYGIEGKTHGIYNFYTGRKIADVDGDGVRDYVVTNGGNSELGRYDARPAGRLMVISGRNGISIHDLEMPEKRETYCSPLLWRRDGTDWVVFGTGGETFPGSLWAVPVDSVRAGTLDGLQVLVEYVEFKGAIAPPSFADLDGDGAQDLIATPFDGRVVALSGHNLKPLWSFDSPEDEETQSSPAVGDFDGDGDLDLVQVEQVGVFPRWTASIVRIFDGATGEILWERRMLRNLVPASPLAADVDADGRDEIFITQSDAGLFRGEQSTSRMQIIHVEETRIDTIITMAGLNSGAGLVYDADSDGFLEWYVPLHKQGGRGSLVRIDLNAAVPSRIAWGGYFGTQHDGSY